MTLLVRETQGIGVVETAGHDLPQMSRLGRRTVRTSMLGCLAVPIVTACKTNFAFSFQ